MSKYFSDCQTVAEIKKQYRKLAMLHHPDIGGDSEIMKAVNAAYHAALKSQSGKAQTGTDKKERTYKYSEPTEAAIIDKISEILAAQLDGTELWLIGYWIWVQGETKQHRAALGKKGLGLSWHGKRKSWYWKPYEGKSFYNKTSSLNDLADHYGAKRFTGDNAPRQPKQVKA